MALKLAAFISVRSFFQSSSFTALPSVGPTSTENCENQQLASALNNMTQGLCMFDGSARIVVLNQRYRDMYKLSPAIVKPGCTLRRLIEHRKETGLFAGDVDRKSTRLNSSHANI